MLVGPSCAWCCLPGSLWWAVPLEQARAAWLKALKAYVRAARTHEAAAGFHSRLGFPDLAAREFDRAAEERRGYDVAVARHPEWAADVPPWPDAPMPTTPD